MLSRGTEHEKQARSTFEAALMGGITRFAFAEWVYTHPDLAQVVGYADEEDLLTFDYRASDSALRLSTLLRAIYRQWWPGPETTHFLWRSEVVELAQRILQHIINLPAAVYEMVDLSMEQDAPSASPGLFQPFWDFGAEYEYVSEMYYAIDPSPDTRKALADEYAQLETRYRPGIEAACQQILSVFGSL